MATRTVRAARITGHGRPLEVESVPLADPSGDDVVVEMGYAGINPIDRYHALGTVAPDAPLPRTIGVEGVGRLDGRWVALHGYGLGASRDGLWADAAVVPRSAVVPVPDGVEPAAAAAMGVAGVTAVRTVTEVARLTPEDRVLILGASGGVGSMIVSLCDALGATVWGQTAHRDKVAAIERQGAARVVVCDDAGLLGGALGDLRPTAVFDPLGGEFTGAAVQVLAPHGRVVIFGTSADGQGRLPLRSLYRKGGSILGYGGLVEPEDAIGRGLRTALEALRDGSLRVSIDSLVPLEDVNGALERLVRREVSGKLVIDLAAAG